MQLIYIFLILFFFTNKLISIENNIYVYAFESYQSIQAKKTILVGEIKSKVKSANIDEKNPIKEFDTRKDVVTVKVINKKGLKVGQKLYVVYKDPHHEKLKNALIMGEIVVTSLLKHPFYGFVLTGEGNLLRVREGFYVVRDLESENIEKAYFLKRKADNLFEDENYEEASNEYLKSIKKDTDLPESHFALGSIYYKTYQKDSSTISLQNALKEFHITWELKNRFRFNIDLYRFLKIYSSAQLDYFLIEKNNDLSLNRINNLKDILNLLVQISEECQKISNDIECKMSKAIGMYYLLKFYMDESTPEKRTLYDKYKMELGLLLKEIEKNTYEKNYEKFLDFQNQNVKFYNQDINLIQYEYIFIQYYYILYNELDSFKQQKEKSKLKQLLKKHIQDYFILSKDKQRFHNENLEILQIKNYLD